MSAVNPSRLRCGVVGAGTMGQGIAQILAQAGFEVDLFDAAPGKADVAARTIGGMFDKLVSKGKLSADQVAKIISDLGFPAQAEV